MAILVLIVFFMGLLSLIFGIFEIFDQLGMGWGLGLMVIAYLMFYQIWKKERQAEKERLHQHIQELEALLKFGR